MSVDAVDVTAMPGTWPPARRQPFRFAGLLLLLALRLLYGLFFFQAGVNKMLKGWDYPEYLREVFQIRLTELNPSAFAYAYLEHFGIPFVLPIAFVVAFGELLAGFGLLTGLATRASAWLAFFILVNIAIGGYYDASLLPFFIINGILCFHPLGRHFGLDRALGRKYPGSWWFR